MEEKDATPKEEPEAVKSQWQLQKENWYDRVPLPPMVRPAMASSS